MDESFQDQLKRVRNARGLSRSKLSHATARIGDEGIAEITIGKLEGKKARRPRERTILVLGEALNATDEEFPAYALAKARRALDEEQVGLSAALDALDRVRALLYDGATSPAGDAALDEPNAALQTLAKHARSRQAGARSESRGARDAKRDTGQ